jgi:hypothetical protein
MKHLDAFGVIIDTKKLIKDKDNIKYYQVIGLRVIDLISGEIENRTSDFRDVYLTYDDVTDNYIGYNTSSGEWNFYTELDGLPLIGYFPSVSVYDISTGEVDTIGDTEVCYKISSLLYLKLNLLTGNLRYIHGLDAIKLTGAEDWDEGAYTDTLGMGIIYKDTELFSYLTDQETGTIIFDTTVCVFDSKKSVLLPKGCKCLDIADGGKINKLVCNKELEYIKIDNGRQLKTVYISKESSKEFICNFIINLGYASRGSFSSKLYLATSSFLEILETLPADEAFQYCKEPKNKEVVDEILKNIEIIVY